MKIHYTVSIEKNGKEEYLRKLYGSDSFTDDLGNALLFDTREEIPEMNGDEYVVRVLEDEEGGLRILPDWSDEYHIYLIGEVKKEAKFVEDKAFCQTKTLQKLSEEELKKLFFVLKSKNRININ